MDHIHAVAHGELLGELGIELDVGLGVVADDLDLTPEQPAIGIDFFDRQFDGIDHRLSGGG